MDAEENFPLPGVTIENLVSRRGTLSDENGYYALAARSGDSLRFTFLGKRQLVAVYRGRRSTSASASRKASCRKWW